MQSSHSIVLHEDYTDWDDHVRLQRDKELLIALANEKEQIAAASIESKKTIHELIKVLSSQYSHRIDELVHIYSLEAFKLYEQQRQLRTDISITTSYIVIVKDKVNIARSDVLYHSSIHLRVHNGILISIYQPAILTITGDAIHISNGHKEVHSISLQLLVSIVKEEDIKVLSKDTCLYFNYKEVTDSDKHHRIFFKISSPDTTTNSSNSSSSSNTDSKDSRIDRLLSILSTVAPQVIIDTDSLSTADCGDAAQTPTSIHDSLWKQNDCIKYRHSFNCTLVHKNSVGCRRIKRSVSLSYVNTNSTSATTDTVTHTYCSTVSARAKEAEIPKWTQIPTLESMNCLIDDMRNERRDIERKLIDVIAQREVNYEELYILRYLQQLLKCVNPVDFLKQDLLTKKGSIIVDIFTSKCKDIFDEIVTIINTIEHQEQAIRNACSAQDDVHTRIKDTNDRILRLQKKSLSDNKETVIVDELYEVSL